MILWLRIKDRADSIVLADVVVDRISMQLYGTMVDGIRPCWFVFFFGPSCSVALYDTVVVDGISICP